MGVRPRPRVAGPVRSPALGAAVRRTPSRSLERLRPCPRPRLDWRTRLAHGSDTIILQQLLHVNKNRQDRLQVDPLQLRYPGLHSVRYPLRHFAHTCAGLPHTILGRFAV